MTFLMSFPSHVTPSAGEHNDIAVRIFQPDLAVVRIAIDVGRFEDLRRQRASALHRGDKVVDLKPEEDSIPVRAGGRIAEVRMVVRFPRVRLKQPLVPATTRLDVSNRN
jgi:hypothetical protein